MGLKLINGPSLWSTDRGALQLVDGGVGTLLQLGDPGLRLPQVLQHLGAEVLVELEYLQFGFRDLAARACDLGDQLATFALQPRLVALQLLQPRDRYQVLGIELLDAAQFVGDVVDLLTLRLLLRRQTTDLLADLSNPLTQLRSLAVECVAPRVEQPTLTGERGCKCLGRGGPW